MIIIMIIMIVDNYIIVIVIETNASGSIGFHDNYYINWIMIIMR